MKRRYQRPIRGFTLIELIMAMIIIGVLSSTAAPKMIDLVYDAGKSFDKTVASSISQWGQVNLMSHKMGDGNAFAISAEQQACTAAVNSVRTASNAFLIGDIKFVFDRAAESRNEYRIKSDVKEYGAGSDRCNETGKVITCVIEAQGGWKTPFYIPCTN